jgi:hypothetical protein
MGYRSDVVLMAVFANAEEHDEVMAVYRMDALAQKYDLEKSWRRVNLEGGEVVLIYEATNVKWYESYEDVQGFEYMSTLLDTFHNEREFNYAWGSARIGENEDDTVYDVFSPDSNDLIEIVYNNLGITRRIDLSL